MIDSQLLQWQQHEWLDVSHTVYIQQLVHVTGLQLFIHTHQCKTQHRLLSLIKVGWVRPASPDYFKVNDKRAWRDKACKPPHIFCQWFSGVPGASSAPSRLQEGEHQHHHHGHRTARRVQILLLQQDDHSYHCQAVNSHHRVLFVSVFFFFTNI